MSDRTNYLTVALEQEFRVDDCGPLIAAIKQLRGVVDVQVNVARPTEFLAESRVHTKLAKKLMAVLYPTKEMMEPPA